MRKSRRRFDDEHEEHIPESWLIPYADILTLLLALFIVLFASGEIDKTRYDAIMQSFQSELNGKSNVTSEASHPNPPSSKEPAEQIEPYPDGNTENETELNLLKLNLEKYIAENKLQDVITLADTERGVEVSLRDVILFDPGRDNLKGSSFQTLDTISGLIKTVSNQVSIEGHTDNVPIGNAPFHSNWELSSARAVSVVHYFASQGIDEKRLQFTGFGEFQPLQPNDTDEQRQTNRRVNIVILRAK